MVSRSWDRRPYHRCAGAVRAEPELVVSDTGCASPGDFHHGLLGSLGVAGVLAEPYAVEDLLAAAAPFGARVGSNSSS